MASNREYYLKNRERLLEQVKEYQERNKEHIKARRKRWYEENRERVLEQRRQYYEENRDKIALRERGRRKQRAEYMRRRRLNDTNAKLAEKIRMLHRRLIKRTDTTTNYELGCDIDYYLQHVESLFQPGMTWDNTDEWELDHIRPLSNFNLENPEEFKKAIHYSNVRPLWREENRRKAAKYD